MRLIVIILFTLLVGTVCAQDTIFVPLSDSTKLYLHGGDWTFYEGIPDGHYIGYRESKGIKYPSVEVFIENGKKNGLESRYYSYDFRKFAEINWKDGRKNGIEKHFNVNRTTNYILTFRKDTLNGYAEANWSEGAKRWNGYFKNGFRDGIWNFYDHHNDRSDSTNYWLSERYEYTNGIGKLATAWDRNGNESVKNGNGKIEDKDSWTFTTEYSKGLRNGLKTAIDSKGNLYYEEIYENDLLIEERKYFNNGKVNTIKKYCYEKQIDLDTNERFVDTYITKTDYWRIEDRRKPIFDGKWTEYFENGSMAFKGSYNKGEQIGVWTYYYTNGNKRLVANHSNNTFEYYDSTGNVVSNFNGDLLNILSNGYWFLDDMWGKSKLTMLSQNKNSNNIALRFHLTGRIELKTLLLCGLDIDDAGDSYILNGNKLTIFWSNQNNEISQYDYEVIAADKLQIELKLIEK
jgi:antitoxin component YwqK of YwqJK toxin-antitoxin module